MGGYTIIADVGKTIIDMLKNQMCPEPVSKPENIGICDPKERGDFILGIHPYNTKENTESRSTALITLPDGSQTDPPVSYEVSYIISVVSKAEPAVRSLDEQRIFGRLLQIMADNQSLPRDYMPESLKKLGTRISVRMLSIELEEKIKIWSMFNEPYKLSAFYTVGPIDIESGVIRRPARRVASVHFNQEPN